MLQILTIPFRLAESTVSTIFEETILRHLTTRGSQLRTQLDPLPLFPIEFGFKKDVYRCLFPVTFTLRLLVIIVQMWRPVTPMCITSRWQSLIQCSWHETRISSTVRSGFSSAYQSPGCLDSTSCKCNPSELVTSYDFVFRRNAYLFTFIPAGGSGDFNVDLKDVRVSLAVILRHTEELGLQMEHFRGESNCD